MKGSRVKCLSFALFFALSSIVSFISFSAETYAQSPYDNTISKANSVIAHNPWSPSCTEPLDYTESLISKITDDEHYRYFWNGGSNLGYSSQLIRDEAEELKQAIENNAGQYAIVQHVGLDNVKEIVFYWNPNAESTETTFEQYGNNSTALVFPPDGYKQMIFRIENFTCRTDMYIWTGGFGTPQLAFYDNDYSKHTRKPYKTNISITYPEGYEGEQVAVEGGSQQNIIFPNIVAEVADKQVSIMHKKHPLVEGDYKVFFFVHNSTTDENPPPDQEPFALSGNMNPDEWETFSVPSYGQYALEAVFVGTDGEQSSFQPPDGMSAVQGGTLIDVQGGIFGVDTDDMICEVHPTEGAGQSCKYPTLEESLFECSPTALDGCIKNIMFYIADWLGFPMHQGSPMTGQISRYRSESFGLMPIIDAPISVFQRMATNNHNCAPLVLNMGHFDQITLPCLSTVFQRGELSPFFSVYQTIINGAVAYWVIMGLFRMVKESQDPAHDQIEVAKL